MFETFFLRDSSQCKNFKRTSSGSPEKTTMSRRNDQQVMMIAMIQLMIALTLLNHDWGVENLFIFGCTVRKFPLVKCQTNRMGVINKGADIRCGNLSGILDG